MCLSVGTSSCDYIFLCRGGSHSTRIYDDPPYAINPLFATIPPSILCHMAGSFLRYEINQ